MLLVNPQRVRSGRLVSPVVPATAADLHALRKAISPARLGTYLKHSHFNTRRAMALYEWNIRAGAALVSIFQANEIALRNAVNSGLVQAFGPEWPFSPGFLRALPARERTGFEGEIRRLQARLRSKPSTGDVVAAQTFWFWVFLLTARFQNRVWDRGFSPVFAHAPPRVDRAVVHARADDLRRLRNRIAHHEPLLRYDLPGAYGRALSIIRWISPVKARWVEERWPLRPEITRRP